MITVTVKNNPSVVTQVKTAKTAVSSLNFGETKLLSQLTDVNASDPDDNEVLVYDEIENKYVVKTLPKVQGGTF